MKGTTLKPYPLIAGLIGLFLTGCGGGGNNSNAPVLPINLNSDAPSPATGAPVEVSYIVSGQVTADTSGVDNIAVVVAPSANQGQQGYIRTVTSGGGQFSVQVPWSNSIVMASNDQYIGYARTSLTGSLRVRLKNHMSSAENVTLESMSDFAVPNPPNDFPPSDFSDSVSSSRPRIFPVLLVALAEVLEDALAVAVSTHFVQDFLERDVSFDEVVDTLDNGEAFYDPKYDTIVRWKDGIALSLTQGENRLISVIKGMDRPTSRWVPFLSHVRHHISSGQAKHVMH